MILTTSATIDIACPREKVFEFSTSCDTYVRLFRKRGPVAGIARAELLDGAPLAVGTRRLIGLDDGAVLEETIVAHDAPGKHAYRWSGGLHMPASALVRTGEGTWIFGERNGKTSIDWQYAFTLTTPLVYPFALVLRSQFQLWMQQQLRAIADALDGSPR